MFLALVLSCILPSSFAAPAQRMPAAQECPNEILRFGDLILLGEAPVYLKAKNLAARFAPHNIHVYLHGESGVGKELFARYLHYNSPRASKPFIACNAAAFTETIVESELFGHERGAFTGASAKRAGVFEQADGGTLFLDEIGDLPMAVQIKLLRVLDGYAFQRVGGTDFISPNVRVVVATNLDLAKEVEEKRFRMDLFHRITAAVIQIPPLRQRPQDIELLANHYLKPFKTGSSAGLEFSPEALAAMQAHPWTGNVRELSNLVTRAAVMAQGPQILPEDLGLAPATPSEDPIARTVAGQPFDLSVVTHLLGLFEPTSLARASKTVTTEVQKALLLAALRATNNRVGAAAELLKINRTTLHKQLKALNLVVPETE